MMFEEESTETLDIGTLGSQPGHPVLIQLKPRLCLRKYWHSKQHFMTLQLS